ncbi:hypothetical protein [Streptomyces sp. NPDC006739]|uniref:Rv1733c family protein n=1 Tax=Streptomyces sp. NPDC006739 TaxID=3364763 RepID=UPI0036A2D62F
MPKTPPTTSGTPTRLGLWRWRRNPLRRHSDIVEAWVVLAAWVLALLGGAFAGVLAGQVTDSAFDARRAQVHAVSAVLADGAQRTAPAGTGYDDGRVWATVRWTDADGSVHQGRAKVLPGVPVGTRLTVWTDRTGQVVPHPAGEGEAALQAVLTGVLVASLAGTAVWAGGWLVRTGLVRRRLAEWDEEWKRVGPEWRNFSGGRG